MALSTLNHVISGGSSQELDAWRWKCFEVYGILSTSSGSHATTSSRSDTNARSLTSSLVRFRPPSFIYPQATAITSPPSGAVQPPTSPGLVRPLPFGQPPITLVTDPPPIGSNPHSGTRYPARDNEEEEHVINFCCSMRDLQIFGVLTHLLLIITLISIIVVNSIFESRIKILIL